MIQLPPEGVELPQQKTLILYIPITSSQRQLAGSLTFLETVEEHQAGEVISYQQKEAVVVAGYTSTQEALQDLCAPYVREQFIEFGKRVSTCTHLPQVKIVLDCFEELEEGVNDISYKILETLIQHWSQDIYLLMRPDLEKELDEVIEELEYVKQRIGKPS